MKSAASGRLASGVGTKSRGECGVASRLKPVLRSHCVSSDDRYTVIGKSLDQLLHDLDRGNLQGAKAGEAYELAQAAISVKAAKAAIRWTKVAAVSACISTVVAVAP
jgi:hypothetical protein